MAPFRGRGGRGRGGVRGGRGGRGGGRGGAQDSGRLARSGIKTENGYRKFDSQRVKEVDSEEEQPQIEEQESESEREDLSDDGEVEDLKPKVKAYNTLLQSFHKPEQSGERKAKRRKVEHVVEREESSEDEDGDEAGVDEEMVDGDVTGQDDDAEEQSAEEEEASAGIDDEGSHDDPYEIHFAHPDDNELSRRLESIQSAKWKTEKQTLGKHTTLIVSAPECVKSTSLLKAKVPGVDKLHLKERLARNAADIALDSDAVVATTPYIFDYHDILLSGRTPQNAESLRKTSALHAVNHVLKGRDKVLKNNERLSHAEPGVEIEAQDQGFVRPKVLILTETRQMAARYADAIVHVFQPEQQEHRRRFDDAFSDPVDNRETMPDDYRELFSGNNDNSFLTALKFTRKTLKFYSGFYNSDIILASPLGLRRIIENEDKKKQDYDFLSSIEVLIADQVDAMYMQNWENVEVVFSHLNLELRQTHDCDFSRVRPWYLDGNAKYMRQTILFSAYVTPEMNRLWNTHMLNIAGKVKLTSIYSGAIAETSCLGIKQTFSRFDSPSPATDPDSRFKYFTTAILPRLLRLPKPADGAKGILIFIPSYFDFLRIRNFFATSSQTENISFGAIHDYSEVSDQRRARSHFSNGRHSILLYTQRAHHFFRLKIKGVKRVVMYGMPDNQIFYQELVEGYLGTSVSEGKIDPVEASVRGIFSKWDGLRLERVVGSERVKGMLAGAGDTFDFI